ncbi:MAG: NADPH-dependent 2,4-dienoyl-CoA reductase/sulfur reductase-like enzyme [Saprospiraceae bacterium]|jgi:NADPH-dependent 2,4-dienoyl-CoA reductase/sulfur reductase-like enzyme
MHEVKFLKMGIIKYSILLVVFSVVTSCGNKDNENISSSADIVVFGRSPSGLSAAIQPARLGSEVILVEPYSRIGGMMFGGLTRTDLGDRASTGGLAREFFKRLAAYYDEENKRWESQPMEVFFEPHVAENIWRQMLEGTGRIRTIIHAHLMRVVKDGMARHLKKLLYKSNLQENCTD